MSTEIKYVLIDYRGLNIRTCQTEQEATTLALKFSKHKPSPETITVEKREVIAIYYDGAPRK
jgi:hypothetical protein